MEFTPLDKRIWIKGLTLECPFLYAQDDCPLNALRHLPTQQINKTVNNMTDRQIHAMVNIHKNCHKERLREIHNKERTQTGHQRKTFPR